MTEDESFSVKKAIEYIQLRFKKHILSTEAVENAVKLCFRAGNVRAKFVINDRTYTYIKTVPIPTTYKRYSLVENNFINEFCLYS